MEAIKHLRSHDVIAGGQVSNERQMHRLMLKIDPKIKRCLPTVAFLFLLTAICWSSLCFLPNTSAYWVNYTVYGYVLGICFDSLVMSYLLAVSKLYWHDHMRFLHYQSNDFVLNLNFTMFPWLDN